MSKSSVTRTNPNAILGSRRAVEDLAALEVQVGWSERMDATPETVAKAVFNTLGTKSEDESEDEDEGGIPPRDAITPAVISSLDLVRATTIRALRSHDPMAALKDLANELEIALQRSVEDFSSPGNAASTIKRKGIDDPLVATGTMRDQAAAKVFRK